MHRQEMIGTQPPQLKWSQPSFWKRFYELRSEQELVATLNFVSSSSAIAGAMDECWTFKRGGFLPSPVTIHTCKPEVEVASYKSNTWRSGGTLTLADGRKLLASTSFWKTALEIQTESGFHLVRLETSGFWGSSANVSISPVGMQMPELSWMVLFAWYLVVMMQRDDAVLGVVAAT